MDSSPTLSRPPSPPLTQANSLLQLDSFAPGEAFHVDDLLDLPFDDDASCPAIEDGISGSFSQHSMELFACDTGKLGLCGWNERIGLRAAAGESVVGQEIAQSSVSELCMPFLQPDDLADQLEWLSAFVEDSSYSADVTLASLGSSDCLSAGKLESDALSTRETFQSRSPVSVLEQAGGSFSERLWCLSPSFTVPGRARSKRSRTGGRVWSLDTLISISVDNKIGSGDKVFMDCSGENYLSSSEQEGDLTSVRPTKKTKKASAGSKSVDASLPRKCAHCLVQKTPQWRAGPMGPKTLCNACGVRYKSGRLVPEYRPAGSPSFVTEVHSNSHKRILEMRRLKEFETCEEHKVIVQVSECEGGAEEESLGARPGAVLLTLVEQAPQGQEVNCHSQYGSCEKDDGQEENSANSKTDFPAAT